MIPYNHIRWGMHMNNVWSISLVFVLIFPGLISLIPAEDVKADEAVSGANILYVDDSGGSTYTSMYT
ncbi:MAG: hypothetical protein ACMUHY_05390, partial [Thermoplasmatota archaeon]